MTRSATLGVHGVRLKHFEQVMVRLLPVIQPQYVSLPPMSIEFGDSKASLEDYDHDYPFSILPSSARVRGDAPGQLKDAKRARRKEGQLQSILRCVLPLVERRSDTSLPYTIVDFGGGSGHLGIPLALLLPHCRIIVVDFNKRSIKLMHEKAEKVIQQIQREGASEDLSRFTATKEALKVSAHLLDKPLFRSCAGQPATNPAYCGVLANLFSFQGPVEQFQESFDMGLALHLCGEATDVAIRKAIAAQATAMVLTPCCVGKLSQKAFNPDVFNATGQSESVVSYPQSSLFCRLVGCDGDQPMLQKQQDDWDALAKAADYSNEEDCGTSRNATRRTAKALLETDRRLFLEEQKVVGHIGYKTALTRMEPFDVSPKNDILVAWRQDFYGKDVDDLFSVTSAECQADVEVAKSHLMSAEDDDIAPRNDWTREEEGEIQSTLKDFLEHTRDTDDYMDQVYLFPTQMGARKRKLIHFVAEKMNLAHWSHGAKDSLKTVAVARRGRRRRTQQVADLGPEKVMSSVNSSSF